MLFIFATIVELTLVAYIDKMKTMRAQSLPVCVKPRKDSTPKSMLSRSFSDKKDLVLKCLGNKSDRADFSPNNNAESIKPLSENGHSKRASHDTPVRDSESLMNARNGRKERCVEEQMIPKKTKKVVYDTGYRIDIAFRVLYPLAFALFNIVYWPLLISRNLL